MSGHAHAHVPRPFPVKPPDARDHAIAEAAQHLAAHHQADAERTEAERAAAEAQRTGIPAPGTYAPLDDEAVRRARRPCAAHGRRRAGTPGTPRTGRRRWTAAEVGQIWALERAKAHSEIAQQIAAKAVAVPSEGRAVLATGLPGPRKAAALKKAIDPARHATVSPDAIKEELARRGLVPEAEGLSPAERGALVHPRLGMSRIWRSPGWRLPARTWRWTSPVPARRLWARTWITWPAAGTPVHGVHVHTPADAGAAARAHRKGLESYRQGKGNGARLAPPDLVRSAETRPGSTGQPALQTMTPLRRCATGMASWQDWDATGKPELTEKSAEPQTAGIMSVEDLLKRSTP